LALKTVFYIDDDPDDIAFFRRVTLKLRPDIEVITFLDPEEGLNFLKGMPTPPSIIFLDLHMVKMSGLECVIAIKRQPTLRRIPIILFSGELSRHQIIQFNSIGVYQFISKSTIEDLENSLRFILED
jgi:response regulator RpfG family c-di-GMP phosphodiesterase